MNQHEWVYGCYAYYLENYIEPGNPEDGVWEDAHWPVPKCLGGTKTIPLLKEHHAVQGVLQSEEWQRCCIWGWEKGYLAGWLLERAQHWMQEQRRTAGGLGGRIAKGSSVSETMRRTWVNRTSEERARILTKTHEASRTSERANATRLLNMRTGNKQRWRCTVTGFECNTAGGLSTYQKARGIDRANRERLD